MCHNSSFDEGSDDVLLSDVYYMIYNFIKPRQSLKCLIAQSSKARACEDSKAVNLKISAGIKAAATGNGGRSHLPPSKTPPRMKLQPHTFVPGPTIPSSAPRYPASSANVDAITSHTESSRGDRGDRPSLHPFHPPAYDTDAPLFSKINMVASAA